MRMREGRLGTVLYLLHYESKRFGMIKLGLEFKRRVVMTVWT